MTVLSFLSCYAIITVPVWKTRDLVINLIIMEFRVMFPGICPVNIDRSGVIYPILGATGQKANFVIFANYFMPVILLFHEALKA